MFLFNSFFFLIFFFLDSFPVTSCNYPLVIGDGRKSLYWWRTFGQSTRAHRFSISFSISFPFLSLCRLIIPSFFHLPLPRRMISRLKRVPVLVPVLVPVARVGAEFSGGESFQFFFFILFYFILIFSYSHFA